LRGDVIGGLPSDLGSTARFLGFHCGIAGRLLGGLTGNVGQPGSVALGNARIASDADSVSGGLSCRESRPRLQRPCRALLDDEARQRDSALALRSDRPRQSASTC